ncbi:hypothetical protein DMH17_17180 [Raoultella planticola]|nr:hypothetical protein [Raoultella planticola]
MREFVRRSSVRRSASKMLMATIACLRFCPMSATAALRIEQHLEETGWCWIMVMAMTMSLYYRIQSPVVMLEFDHHSGMWLTNEQPARFHIHTITRIPNGNDYGKALLAQTRK